MVTVERRVARGGKLSLCYRCKHECNNDHFGNYLLTRCTARVVSHTFLRSGVRYVYGRMRNVHALCERDCS